MTKNKATKKDLLAYYKLVSMCQKFGLGLAYTIWDRDISIEFKEQIVEMLEVMNQSLIKLRKGAKIAQL